MTTNPRILGIDCLSPITPTILDAATHAMGQAPAFVGRYFTTMSTPGSGEYHHRVESPVLAAHDIRVLPIARQTNHVSGTHDAGFAGANRPPDNDCLPLETAVTCSGSTAEFSRKPLA